jgi:hypothetical protein
MPLQTIDIEDIIEEFTTEFVLSHFLVTMNKTDILDYMC